MDAVKAQLWGLLVVASVDPRLWAEKGTNEGKLEEVEPRQLDGLSIKGRRSVRRRYEGGERAGTKRLLGPGSIVRVETWSAAGASMQAEGGRAGAADAVSGG